MQIAFQRAVRADPQEIFAFETQHAAGGGVDVDEAHAGAVDQEDGDGDCGPSVVSLSLGTVEYDCIVHAYQHRILAEFEVRTVPATDVAMFAVKAHSSIDHLRRQKTVAGLMDSAVKRIRDITGFDRVMAYRFRQDDSGNTSGLAPIGPDS